MYLCGRVSKKRACLCVRVGKRVFLSRKGCLCVSRIKSAFVEKRVFVCACE